MYLMFPHFEAFISTLPRGNQLCNNLHGAGDKDRLARRSHTGNMAQQVHAEGCS